MARVKMLWCKIGKRKARAEKNQREMRTRRMLYWHLQKARSYYVKYLIVIQSEMRGQHCTTRKQAAMSRVRVLWVTM